MAAPYFIFLLFAFTVLPTEIRASFQNFTIDQIHGNYSKVMEFDLDCTKEVVIWFDKSLSVNPYRVSAWMDDSALSAPIMIVVIQEHQVTSWKVPFLVDTTLHDNRLEFLNTSRTLCHNQMPVITEQKFKLTRGSSPSIDITQNFIITLTTASDLKKHLYLMVEEEEDFYVETDRKYSISVSPSQTRYFYYQFPANGSHTDTAVIQINSEDDVCFTVSIQNSFCPVFDLDEDIAYEGKYQTLNRKGGMSIRRAEYPSGFFVVFVAKTDNLKCSEQSYSVVPIARSSQVLFDNRTSTIEFTISKGITGKSYSAASLLTLSALLGFSIVALVITVIFNYFGTISKKRLEVPTQDSDVEVLTPEDIKTLLRQKDITLNLLARSPLKNQRRALNYLWHILSVAIFYSIPVVQLVFTYQRIVNKTGDQDMCYYNFLCANPAFGLSDFNHVFSNVGYAVTGVLFLVAVLLRNRTLPYNDVGVPVQYGIFYAMGIALILEGVLSACYHICPSQSNYQFDTSFMYIMIVLCMVKLYQNRHPDINATAYATFTVLGLTIFLAMIGILNGRLAVWIVLVIVYTLLCIYISCKVYFIGFVLEGFKTVKNSVSEEGFQSLAPMRKARLCVLVLANVINYAILISGLYLYATGATDFATFLLALLMANIVLYCLFYTCMKYVHRERMCYEAILYGVLAIAFWISSTIFFVDSATKWAVTPAESRRFNQECIWMGFFDKHDVWHLLSAPALYFSFMFLLCLDDDLIDTKRTDIIVF